MSLKTKLAKTAKTVKVEKAALKKAAAEKSPPRTPKAKKPKERREAPRVQEVLGLFAKDGTVTPGAEWVIEGQGVAHPLGAISEVLTDVPRTKDGLMDYFFASPLKGILFDGGPGKPVGVLREDVGA